MSLVLNGCLAKVYSVQDARPRLVHEAITRWINRGILRTRGEELVFEAHPAPITIPRHAGRPFQIYLDDESVPNFPRKTWHGEIHVLTTPQEAADAVKDILLYCRTAVHAETGIQGSSGSSPDTVVLGFDLEFKPFFRAGPLPSPPTVVQVATPSAVYLFHLRAFSSGKSFRTQPSTVAQAVKVRPATTQETCLLLQQFSLMRRTKGSGQTACCERAPAARRLMQRHVALTEFNKALMQVLRPLLEAEHIWKCGVGATGDVQLMQKYYRHIPYRYAAISSHTYLVYSHM